MIGLAKIIEPLCVAIGISRLRASIRCAVCCVALAFVCGCRTSAPVHVWQPPSMQVEPSGVAFMGVSGPDEWADPIEEALLTEKLDGWRFIAADQLQDTATIRLVSATDEEPSDMAVSAAARQQGLRYLLHGEVLQATGHEDRKDKLIVSWRLTGLQPGAESAGMPVTIDEALIQQRYPHLLFLPNVAERTRQAAILETKRLLAANVDRQQVKLAAPKLLPGARAIRRGNDLARSGNWPMAEKVWNEVLQKHPRNPAALINCAVAATARQDFTLAKQHVTEAVRRSALSPVNQSLAEETLVWIELRQRDYHQAFDLPPPPEGWLISRGD